MKLRFILIVLLLYSLVFADFEFLNRVSSFKELSNGVKLFFDNNDKMDILFVKDDIVRYIYYNKNNPDTLLDYVLEINNDKMSKIKIKENGNVIELLSSQLIIKIFKDRFRTSIFTLDGRMLIEDDKYMSFAVNGNEVKTYKKLQEGLRFYGLGEKTGHLEKRGGQYILYNRDIPAYTEKTDALYQSIPFFIGVNKDDMWGIYFNNSYRSVFNFGASTHRYFSFGAEGGYIDYFFIYANNFDELLEKYTFLTGRQFMPPLWSLGYQQCRWSYFPDSEVLSIAKTFRERKLPADVIYLDIDYMDNYKVFTWNNERFPKPHKMNDKLHKMGFKLVTIIDPGVKAEDGYFVADQGLKNNYFVKYPDGEVYIGDVWPGKSYFTDFSNEEASRWWGNLYSILIKSGVDGFWNDMNEPAVWGQAFPPEVVFFDKGRIADHRKFHNLYGYLEAKSAYNGVAGYTKKRPFILTRAGFAGIQKYAAVWTGDNVASWEHLRIGIRMLLNLSISGVPFVGTDVGGFIDNPDGILFTRWFQVGAFSPFFRTHSAWGTNRQEPWVYNREVENICRKFLNFRYRIIPYLYSQFYISHKKGVPILKPLFWYDPQDIKATYYIYEYQFYFGDKMLIAPVTYNCSLQKVYLPKGKWFDYNNFEVLDGLKEYKVEVPLAKIPIYLKEGAIIPLRDPVQYTDEKPINELTLEIFPGDLKEDSISFYEDDGSSFDFMKDKYRITVYKFIRNGKDILFKRVLRYNNYKISNRDIILNFYGIATEPQAVLIGKKKIDYRYIPEKLLLVINAGKENRLNEIKIIF